MERCVRLCGDGGELLGRAIDVDDGAGLRHGQLTAVVRRGVGVDGVIAVAGYAVHAEKAAVGQQTQHADDHDHTNDGHDSFLHAHTPFRPV